MMSFFPMQLEWDSDICKLVKVGFFFKALNILFHESVLLYKRQIDRDAACAEICPKEVCEFQKILFIV